jgi:hypothetical protein
VIPLSVVRDLVAGVPLAMWRKIGAYAAEFAEMADQARLVEWYEWLVRRVEEDESKRPSVRASERLA